MQLREHPRDVEEETTPRVVFFKFNFQAMEAMRGTAAQNSQHPRGVEGRRILAQLLHASTIVFEEMQIVVRPAAQCEVQKGRREMGIEPVAETGVGN